MSGDQNQAVFRRVIEEGFNKGNMQALDDCFPPRYVEHQFDLPSTLDEFKSQFSKSGVGTIAKEGGVASQAGS